MPGETSATDRRGRRLESGDGGRGRAGSANGSGCRGGGRSLGCGSGGSATGCVDRAGGSRTGRSLKRCVVGSASASVMGGGRRARPSSCAR